MTFLTSWEDFEKSAERLYLQDPMKVRTSFFLCSKKAQINFVNWAID